LNSVCLLKTPWGERGMRNNGAKPLQSHYKATTKPLQSHPKPPQSHILAIYLGVQSHLKARPKRHQSHTKAIPKPHQSHTKATPKPYQSLGAGITCLPRALAVMRITGSIRLRTCRSQGIFIKLGIVHSCEGLCEVFPLLSAAQANPAGLTVGSRGRFGAAGGNAPRTRGLETLASRRWSRRDEHI